jgi:hypothetical protein
MPSTTKTLIGVAIALIAGGIFLSRPSPQFSTDATINEDQSTVIVYKSPTCGCCGNYAAFLKRKGMNVDIREIDDVSAIKAQYGVPVGKESCHTSIIGDYVVEGHVPTEAIEQLLAERPDIAGIGLAGMPQGSPGMPGGKSAPFDVYAFDSAGAVTPFGQF